MEQTGRPAARTREKKGMFGSATRMRKKKGEEAERRGGPIARMSKKNTVVPFKKNKHNKISPKGTKQMYTNRYQKSDLVDCNRWTVWVMGFS